MHKTGGAAHLLYGLLHGRFCRLKGMGEGFRDEFKAEDGLKDP
jgi:hypothetical protein